MVIYRCGDGVIHWYSEENDPHWMPKLKEYADKTINECDENRVIERGKTSFVYAREHGIVERNRHKEGPCPNPTVKEKSTEEECQRRNYGVGEFIKY